MPHENWNYIPHTKRPTQDGLNLALLMKGIGKGQIPVRAIDVGCGDGIISYEILKNKKATHVMAIDIVAAATKAAALNLEEYVRRGQAEVIKQSAGSFFKIKKFVHRFDRFVINPPFFSSGSGTANSRHRDQRARFEGSLSLKVWVKGASRLLNDGGELYCVFPTERLGELLSELTKNNVEAKEIWWLKADLKKRRFFLRAVQGGRPGIKIHFDYDLKYVE